MNKLYRAKIDFEPDVWNLYKDGRLCDYCDNKDAQIKGHVSQNITIPDTPKKMESVSVGYRSENGKPYRGDAEH